MSKKQNGVNYAKTPAHNARRFGALQRLKDQLNSNDKTSKEGKKVPLAEKDVKRIEKEIETLNKRI